MLPSAFTGWVKYHSGGHITDGNDHDVDNSRVSWSRTRLDDLCAVAIKSISSNRDPVRVDIFASHIGVFHQSDDYIAPVLRSGTVRAARVVRRIQRQLNEQDYSFMISRTDSSDLFIRIYSKADAPIAISNSSEYHNVESNIGKWLTIEILDGPNDVKWYLSDSRI